MALRPCPECGHQVSDLAQACPSCGAPFVHATAPVKKQSSPWVVILIVILSVCVVGPIVVVLGTTLPVTRGAKDAAKRAAQISNTKQISLAIAMYVADFDDLGPALSDTVRLKSQLWPFLRTDELWKPFNPNGGEIRGNKNLSGFPVFELPEQPRTVIVYETKKWPNDRGRIVGFADSHVQIVKDESDLIWEAENPLGLPTRWVDPFGR